MKDKLLRIIANTIASNLNGTTDVSLFHGKMGTCMFLYAYARRSGIKQYELWADSMLDDIVHSDKSQMLASIADGYGGLGIGLCWLLQNGYAKGNTDLILQEIDYLLFDNIEMAAFGEKAYNSLFFAPSIYLSWRKFLLPKGDDRAKLWEEKAKTAQEDFLVAQSKQVQTTFRIGKIESNDGLWWAFVLQKTPSPIYYSAILQQLQRLQDDFIYEISHINAYLSILGLSIINNTIKNI